jgi:hypothetical protein
MPLFPLFVLLPYSMTTGFQFLVRWKGTRPLSPTGFCRDLITSPYSPTLLHATMQETGIAIYPSQMGQTPNCWRTLPLPFEWTTGNLINPMAGMCLFFRPLLLLSALWDAGLRLDLRTGTAIFKAIISVIK